MWGHLSEEEARELMSRKNFAHLGCMLEDSMPYVVPVNYLLKNGAIYVHSLEGTKLRALRINRNACVQVEDIKAPYKWKSAIAFGRFEEVLDPDEKAEVLEELLAHFATLTPVEGIEAEQPASEDLVVFRIRVSSLTGVSEN